LLLKPLARESRSGVNLFYMKKGVQLHLKRCKYKKFGIYFCQCNLFFSFINILHSLSCNINKVTGLEGNEERAYSGYMSSENGNKSMNFPEDVEIAPHVTMFESILQEVNEGMAAL
jgi:hypothetical protein